MGQHKERPEADLKAIQAKTEKANKDASKVIADLKAIPLSDRRKPKKVKTDKGE